MNFLADNIRRLRLAGCALLVSGAVTAQDAGTPMTPVPLDDLSAFKSAGSNWQIAGDATADLAQANVLRTGKGKGVLANVPDNTNKSNLVFGFAHADADLALDFMMAKESNSGIYLQGRYELQLLDSWGKKNPYFGDCGGIYERYDDTKPNGQKGYQGVPPRTNAAFAPGLWQHLEVSFQAPRFDAAGNKTANARFLKVVLNGITIHENVEVTGPTRGAAFPDEKTPGPILIQGDHGPVAFRNIRYRSFGLEVPVLSNVQYSYYKGEFNQDTLKADSKFRATKSGKALDLTIENVPAANNFILRQTGTLTVRTPGTYRFVTQVAGMNYLKVDGRLLTTFQGTGLHENRSGTADLTAGDHTVEMLVSKVYSWERPAMGLFLEGPGVRRMALHGLSSMPLDAPVNPILVGVEGEPKIMRCFIDFEKEGRRHRITHAVSVGSPQGANFTMNLNNGALVQCWRGGFLDATPMWHDRGDGHSDPMGSLIRLGDRSSLATLATNSTAWPDSLSPTAAYRFKGYDLDAGGFPTFRYTVFGSEVEDMTRPEDDGKRLTRSLSVSGPAANLYCRVVEGKDIVAQPDGSYLVDDKTFYIRVNGAAKPLLRTVSNRQELLLPVNSGTPVSYSIIW